MYELVSAPIGDGAAVDVCIAGSGDPIVVIQTALDPGELVPLAALLAENCRVIEVGRRGYGTSTPAGRDRTMAQDAADCLAVMQGVGALPSHVVGASYSAAVAMELAASDPDAVATLTLIEPPPVPGEADGGLGAAARRFAEVYAREGITAALDEFARAMGEPSWIAARAELDPDEVRRMERNGDTFFATDIPALLRWRFDAARATAHPVLTIGGTESPSMFAAARVRIREMFPQAEDAVVPRGGHTVAATHSALVADVVTEFVRRHPMR